MQWFITLNGATIGPHEGEVLFAKVRELIGSGQSLAGAHVREEPGGSWMPIENSPFASALAAPEAAAPQEPTPAASQNVTLGQGIVVILVAAAMVGYCSLRDSKGSSSATPVSEAQKPKHDKISAWVMAQEFVKDGLKSPGSADFGSVFKNPQSSETAVTDLGGGKYMVRGWVDSQNSFGAVVRNEFVLRLHYDDFSTKWVLDEGPVMQQR